MATSTTPNTLYSLSSECSYSTRTTPLAMRLALVQTIFHSPSCSKQIRTFWYFWPTLKKGFLWCWYLRFWRRGFHISWWGSCSLGVGVKFRRWFIPSWFNFGLVFCQSLSRKSANSCPKFGCWRKYGRYWSLLEWLGCPWGSAFRFWLEVISIGVWMFFFTTCRAYH